jgi:hypothetical protein
VLPTMPDLVTMFVDPSLVAIGFGLSEQLFYCGSSAHLEHEKSGGRYVKRGTVDGQIKETKVFAVGAMEKGDARTRVQRRVDTIYREPSAMVGPRPARPGRNGIVSGWSRVSEWEPWRRRRYERESPRPARLSEARGRREGDAPPEAQPVSMSEGELLVSRR